MNGRVRRLPAGVAVWVPWVAWVLAVAAAVAGTVLHLVHDAKAPGTDFQAYRAVILNSVIFASLGALVAARRRDNVVGWLLLGAGVFSAFQLVTGEYAMYDRFVLHDRLPGTAVAAWVSQVAVMVLLSLLPFVLYRFPDGRYLSARWRRLGRLAVAVLAVGVVAIALRPGEIRNTSGIDNPYGVAVAKPVVAGFENVAGVPMVFLLVAGVVAMFLRWRRSHGEQRQQLKWVVFVGGFGIVGLLVANILEPLVGAWLPELAWTVGPALLPAAAGLSILRYRLYDIDRIISRTVGYAVVTGLLVAVYVGLVTAVTRLTPGGNSLAVAASTLAVAALFQPVRQRVQAGVDRRFNRSRYDAARTIDAFSARLREEVDLTSLQGDLLGVVRRTMQPAAVGLWLREPRP